MSSSQQQHPSESSESQLSDIEHHIAYGQPGGDAPEEAVTGDDWETNPFVQPVSAPWNVPLSRETLKRLLLGFKPQEMEDKWFVYTTPPAATSSGGEGKAAVMHLVRSWTGASTVDVLMTIEPTWSAASSEDGAKGGRNAEDVVGRIAQVTWEADKEEFVFDTVDQVQQTVGEVCRWVLGVELPGVKLEEF